MTKNQALALKHGDRLKICCGANYGKIATFIGLVLPTNKHIMLDCVKDDGIEYVCYYECFEKANDKKPVLGT